MKNTVYALGKSHPLLTIESFALDLARHFVGTNRQVSTASVSVVVPVWERMLVDGKPHPHTFMQAGSERRTCAAQHDRRGARVRSGIDQLAILKTAGSAFSGFPRDEFTTLRETEDRLLGTQLSASWTYAGIDPDYTAARQAIRGALLKAFASHESRSVQHTLHAMACAALAACGEIDQITLRMPNKHGLLVDLAPFGMTNDNEIFLPVDEPHGMIEATLRRT
jgi:urate oxidase